MEKVICALWKKPDEDRAIFNAGLLANLPPVLGSAGASGIRINVQDDIVASGEANRQVSLDPQPDATVQYWLPSANPIFRADIDAIIARHCDRFAAWLVAESTIIPNIKHPPTNGQRTPGWSQLAFLTLPARLNHAEWRRTWRDYHTRVAIDTQANFEYVQNLVIEPLTDDAPPLVALVEECFPIEALTDPFAFFDAVGDPDKFQRNLDTMMESCDRFIDRGTIDVIPTSQHHFG